MILLNKDYALEKAENQYQLNIIDEQTKIKIVKFINSLPSAQPDRSCIEQIKWERNLAIQQLNELGYSFGEAIRHDKDVISRKGAINAVCTVLYPDADKMNDAKKVLKEMPSAQPESLSDAYTKAVWTWLLDYQIKASELKGRYTPYEVLSWVANDWRKEHER